MAVNFALLQVLLVSTRRRPPHWAAFFGFLASAYGVPVEPIVPALALPPVQVPETPTTLPLST
jgi:hypothetical protein